MIFLLKIGAYWISGFIPRRTVAKTCGKAILTVHTVWSARDEQTFCGIDQNFEQQRKIIWACSWLGKVYINTKWTAFVTFLLGKYLISIQCGLLCLIRRQTCSWTQKVIINAVYNKNTWWLDKGQHQHTFLNWIFYLVHNQLSGEESLTLIKIKTNPPVINY